MRLTKIGNQGIQQIEKKAATISQGKIQWDDAATDLDLAITAENTKVSFDWVVKSENAPHEVQFEIEDGGIPIIYRGVDADRKAVEVSVSKSGNLVTETIQKGGKYPKIINPTLDLDVEASEDDCMVCYLVDNWFMEGVTAIYGLTGYYNSVLRKAGNGLRWDGVTIPAGSTIDHAYFTIVSASYLSNTTVKSRIAGAKEEDPSSWSDVQDYLTRRGQHRTSTRINWDDIEEFEEGN